ncbi:MAG: hypothetical protein PHP50_09295 [Lachnospiraceae bacterium]|nr:hypothetical protein [Lachnospiraceae bacterium]
MYQNKKIVRHLALLLSFGMLFLMLYLVSFEATHELHECSGQDCPVCHELQIAEQLTRQCSAFAAASACSIFMVVYIKQISTTFFCSFQEHNLILDKVRMDD